MKIFHSTAYFGALVSLFAPAAVRGCGDDAAADRDDGERADSAMRGQLQHRRQLSGLLYEYVMTLSGTTPLAFGYDKCVGWPEYSNPENFTWFGLRLQLPDDARTIGPTMYSAGVENLDEVGGIVQPYNMTENPFDFFSTTFQTSEKNPTIRMHLFKSVVWDSYQFTFPDGTNYEEKATVHGVQCNTNLDGSGRVHAVDATLTVAMRQRLIENDPSGGFRAFSGLEFFPSLLVFASGVAALVNTLTS